MSGIDGIGSQRHGIANAVGVSGSDQSGRGVQQDDVSPAGTLAIQNRADDACILLRLTASDLTQRSALQAEILRRHFVNAYQAIAHFGDFAGATRW